MHTDFLLELLYCQNRHTGVEKMDFSNLPVIKAFTLLTYLNEINRHTRWIGRMFFRSESFENNTLSELGGVSLKIHCVIYMLEL